MHPYEIHLAPARTVIHYPTLFTLYYYHIYMYVYIWHSLQKVVIKSQIVTTQRQLLTEWCFPYCTVIKQIHRGNRSHRIVWNIVNTSSSNAEEHNPNSQTEWIWPPSERKRARQAIKAQTEIKRACKGRERQERVRSASLQFTPTSNPSVVLFQECSCG